MLMQEGHNFSTQDWTTWSSIEQLQVHSVSYISFNFFKASNAFENGEIWWLTSSFIDVAIKAYALFFLFSQMESSLFEVDEEEEGGISKVGEANNSKEKSMIFIA